MRQLLVGIVAGMLCIPLLAQDTRHPSHAAAPAAQQNSSSPSPAANPATTPRIAPGSIIPVQLSKTVDAKKAKAGDPVEARVTQDMKTGSGEVLVPKDTKVLGRVTEAQARNKEQKESQMTIAFDHAMMKDGNDVSLPMSIQAIIAPQNPNAGDNNAGAAQPSSASGGGAPSTSGRPSGMGNGAGASTEQPAPSAGGNETGAPAANTSTPAITANTKGVIGLSDVSLSPAGQGSNSSVISSEKKNVKLESGTLMLLRVVPSNQ